LEHCEDIGDQERLGSRRAGRWEDSIPFRYEYTAGVAGERFLRGLLEGRILGARCNRCEITYLPPKMYCTNCYNEITEYRDIGLRGRVDALTQVFVDFRGGRISKPYLMGFVAFKGATGGMIQRITGRGAKIGSRVIAKFKPKARRVGSISDILSFAVEA